jgi:hypothetical protein
MHTINIELNGKQMSPLKISVKFFAGLDSLLVLQIWIRIGGLKLLTDFDFKKMFPPSKM